MSGHRQRLWKQVRLRRTTCEMLDHLAERWQALASVGRTSPLEPDKERMGYDGIIRELIDRNARHVLRGRAQQIRRKQRQAGSEGQPGQEPSDTPPDVT